MSIAKETNVFKKSYYRSYLIILISKFSMFVT